MSNTPFDPEKHIQSVIKEHLTSDIGKNIFNKIFENDPTIKHPFPNGPDGE